jgi:hypothetical protein
VKYEDRALALMSKRSEISSPCTLADADSRRADGRILSGRVEIEKRYRDVMSGGPARIAHAHPTETLRIRFLQSDVAFVDVDSTSVAGQGPRTLFFLVFTNGGGDLDVVGQSCRADSTGSLPSCGVSCQGSAQK